jgi:ketosteroid isomerase-like protein
MNRSILIFACCGVFFTPLLAADAITEVKRADAERVKATIAGDGARLAELLTDDLLYGQNNGDVQSKAEYVNAVVSNQVKYEAFEYQDTKLVQTAPHVVTMTGLVHLKVSRGTTRADFGLRFLAVWREDDGKWRLHAYQSARLPEQAPAPAKASAP